MNKGKYILLLIVMFLLCGCGSNNIDITIDDDDYVILTQTVIVDNDTFETLLPLVKNDSDIFEYNGYTVEKIIGKENSGYKMYKSLGKLYKLDQNKKETIELTGYSKDSFKDEKLFDFKKKFFSNKYVGRFTIDLTNLENASDYLPFLSSMSYSVSGRETSAFTSKEIVELNNKVDTTFTLNTKYRVSNSNATSSKNDTHTWTLKYGQINEIYFEVYKEDNGMIILVVLILLVVAAVYLLVEYRKDLMRQYASVTVKESLDLEHRKEKISEIREIRRRSKNKLPDEKVVSEKNAINERLKGGESFGAYSNLKTIEQLTEEMNEKYKSIKPRSYEDAEDPKFKMIGKQIEETKKEKKKESELFIPKEKQNHNDEE